VARTPDPRDLPCPECGGEVRWDHSDPYAVHRIDIRCTCGKNLTAHSIVCQCGEVAIGMTRAEAERQIDRHKCVMLMVGQQPTILYRPPEEWKL